LPSETLVVRERKGTSKVRPISIEAGTILGSYRIISLIRSGSVGHVFLAEHTILKRRVALKMLRPELSENPKLVRRLFDEARAVNEIAHENIVNITDFVIGEDHPSFYVMELLEGSTLDQLLSERGRLEASLIVEIGTQLASALAAVHDHGIVHRDLKPANVFVVRKRNGFMVKLLDFGVAKMISGNGQSGDTAVGSLMGTPNYMAPEATFGLRVDHRADIYSLGCVLYQMATGRVPFEAEDVAEVFELHRTREPTPPQELAKIPERLAAIILLCLAKRPEKRPSSVRLIRDALNTLVPKRDSGIVRWAAFISVLLLAGAGWMLIDMGRERERIVIQPAVQIAPPAVEIAPEPAPQVIEKKKQKPRVRRRAKAEIEAPHREKIDRSTTKANPYD
jgi:serine/threonine protein kinase